jgi:hypothetical protein
MAGEERASPGHRAHKGLWVALVVLVVLVVAYGVYNLLAANTFSNATVAHRRFDCTRAIDGYDKFLGFYAVAITSHRGIASRRRSECRGILQAEEDAQDDRHNLAAAEYNELVRAYPRSIVVSVLRRRRAEELVRTGDVLVDGAAKDPEAVARAAIAYQTVIVEGFDRRAEATATARIRGLLNVVHAESRCRAAGHLDSIAATRTFTIAETKALGRTARSELAIYLYACGETYFEARRYRQALPYFQRLSRDFRGTRAARLAAVRLISTEVAIVRGGRTNPLPAPAPTGTAAHGEVDLIVRNSSPYSLELLLAGETPRRLTVPACDACPKYTTGSVPAGCPPGPERSFIITPGRYAAVVRSLGKSVTPWSGNWSLTGGSRYAHCFFIVTSPG